MSDQRSTRLYILIAVLAPTATMFASRYIGGAPSLAQADESAMGVDPFAFSKQPFPTLSPATDIKLQASGSPFYFEPVYVARPDRFPAEEPVEIQDDDGVPAPTVTVTSVLPHPKNPLAVIDGKPCRVGDVLPNGWKIQSINGSDFTVTLIHSSGKRYRARLKKTP